jgi:pyruvate kinase
VRVLHRVALEAEAGMDHARMIADSDSPIVPELTAAVSRAACELADSIDADAILSTTTSGATSRMVARLRPAAPVLGLTPFTSVVRQLTVSWGVFAVETEETTDIASLGAGVRKVLAAQGLEISGNRVVVTAGLPVGVSGSTNLIRVLEID